MNRIASTIVMLFACLICVLAVDVACAQDKALKLAFAEEIQIESEDDEQSLAPDQKSKEAESLSDEFVVPLDRNLLKASYDPDTGLPDYEVGYISDKGLFIRGADEKKHPYSLHVGGRLQLRHMGFMRDDEFWTDSVGNTEPILNRNRFEVERARVNLSGKIISPDLSYLIIFDGDGDGASTVDQLAYIMTYRVDDAFKIRVGRWKAATDREWLESSRHFRMVDRSLATEFFRAAFTDGIWILGDIGKSLHYETSLTNGMRTSARRPRDLDDNLGFAATAYVEPLGDYGVGEQDYAYHCSPVVRIGASFGYEKDDDREDAGFPLGDDNFLRLSDGTLLSNTGALAPGVRLLGLRHIKGGFDFGYKYRGWSFSTEYFIRSLQDLTATGDIPVTQIDDHGYRVEMGKFLVPHRLDVNGRISQIMGEFGDAFEYSLGANWYWGNWRKNGKLNDRVNKFSIDVAEIKGAPVTSGPADFTAGDDGVMIRSQVQIGF